MQYANIQQATFQARPNRFIAQVELEGRQETVHVKNTGRCRELLVPGSTVYLVRSDNPARKTQYDLVAAEKGSLLINMDAQAPNRLFQEWVNGGNFLPNITLLRPEYTYGDSRFDFYLEQEGKPVMVEVKGCTLEKDGIARFPDAPTERGVKHIKGLVQAHQAGMEAWLCIVVQMEGMHWFEPNDATHPAFGEALRQAEKAGVHIQALECRVWPGGAEIVGEIPVHL